MALAALAQFWYLKGGPGGRNTTFRKGIDLLSGQPGLPKGNVMKRPSNFLAPRAFTLVEMLVVITIIGILAALGTGAVMHAIHTAKVAVIGVEMNQLDAACKAYKEKFGEYPPDFADTSWPGPISRHLARAFPRCTSISGLNDFQAATGLTTNQLTPQAALTFWLGGMRDTNGVPSGFAADPTNPFQAPAACPSRIGPFFDFDRNRLGSTSASQFCYWPQGAIGNRSTGAGAIVYFRAEDGVYLTSAGAVKLATDVSGATVFPAADTRLSTTAGAVAWINPTSIQIISAGLNTAYSTPGASPLFTGSNNCLDFPSGDNYGVNTYDDITNFSAGGTLEDNIP